MLLVLASPAVSTPTPSSKLMRINGVGCQCQIKSTDGCAVCRVMYGSLSSINALIHLCLSSLSARPINCVLPEISRSKCYGHQLSTLENMRPTTAATWINKVSLLDAARQSARVLHQQITYWKLIPRPVWTHCRQTGATCGFTQTRLLCPPPAPSDLC